KSIAILNHSEDRSVKTQITAMVADNDLDVRTEALLYLSRHDDMDPLTYVEKLGDFADFSIRSATVSFFMRPGESQNPVAARLILNGIVTDLENPALVVDATHTLGLLGDSAGAAQRTSGRQQWIARSA